MPSSVGSTVFSAAFLRYVAVAVTLIFLVGWIKLTPNLSVPRPYGSSVRPEVVTSTPDAPLPDEITHGVHPIDKLITSAAKEFTALLSKETKDVQSAAAAYRERRGRHPPPGFDAWFTFAKEHNALIVEDFFDQIYHDLNPYWGIEPRRLRKEAKNGDEVLSVRNGKTQNPNERPWMGLWSDLIETIQKLLPDLDVPVNGMDESRLVVPWEKIDEYMAAEKKSRQMPPPSEVVQEYTGLRELDAEPAEKIDPKWDKSGNSTLSQIHFSVLRCSAPYFAMARRGCHPESPARKADIQKDFTRPPQLSMHHALPHTYRGYVQNWTLATEFCHQPDLQALHGSFIEPISISTSDQLIPLFGGSKLATNNEILLPPAMYWSHDERYHGGDDHGNPWSEKRSQLIWRGAATGGRNHANTWPAFHRQRLVALLNGTQVGAAEAYTEVPPNFSLPPGSYDLRAARRGHLGEWVSSFGDAGFMDLLCVPPEKDGGCSYTGQRFAVQKSMPMAEQYKYKYLPDLDGNSFSGRYRGFLRSNALPLKATLYKEWHDSRLVAWKHFVPLDNRFLDLYGVVEYFLGYQGVDGAADVEEDRPNWVQGRDAVARRLAEDGQAWAERVLRTDDMQVYVLRLLLEWARVCDDRRERMGWVGDLKGETTGAG
ncbi:MAG: hypothetical protein M1833_004203 [Piccolia ochrophora]|nr:MAG: hypothetical protein M1833_004203 [Piccolia ochrophora]